MQAAGELRQIGASGVDFVPQVTYERFADVAVEVRQGVGYDVEQWFDTVAHRMFQVVAFGLDGVDDPPAGCGQLVDPLAGGQLHRHVGGGQPQRGTDRVDDCRIVERIGGDG